MQRATVGALMAVTIACGGCRGMRDSYTRGPDLWLKVNVGKPGKPSARTVDTLREVDLEKDYYRDPAGTRTALAAQFASQPRRDWCYALADLSFAEGQKAEAAGNTECTEHFYRAIQYSYAYLTAPEIPEPLSPLDPRTRLACDLYNGSLARLICQAKKVGRFDPQRRLVAPIGRGTLDCPVAHRGFPYQPEEFDDLVPAEQAKATELGRDVRTYGLGVPMVGLRKRPEPCEPKDKYLINCHPFAVTALLRPETRSLFAEEVINRHAESELHAVADALHHRMAEAGSRRLPKSAQFERVSYRGPTVELLDPLSIPEIEIGGRRFPVEAELSAPIVHALREAPRGLIEWVGFLDPGRTEKHAGLVMLQPYQKGKIPVVFVHGLLSDPFTWTEMFNELGADPEIRNKYQFWAFFYATGTPFLRSAAMLREDLQKARQLCDPTGEDAAMSQMVMVGHSMGGLLSRLQTSASGDDYWHTITERPFDQIKTRNDEQRERFRKTFYFEPQEYVRRVVFLGTPHRGSAWSPATIGRLGSWLVRVPKMLLNFQQELIADNPGAFVTTFTRQFPTSVDMLGPDSAVLKVLYREDEPRGVHFHSIVGNGVQMGREGQGDGVVPVSSAHLPNADSELLIPETHTMIHRHPRAVLEVKRILKLHAEDAARRMREGRVGPAIVTPADGPTVVLPAK